MPKNALGASSDFEALENLRKLAFAEHVQEPEQLKLALAPPVPEIVVATSQEGVARLL